MNKTIALISGANQGIGLATAGRLAREHDFHVIMGSRNADNGTKAAQQLQSEGLSVESVQLDISSDESITHAAEYITQKYGRLDVLINNAAILIDGPKGNKVIPNITTRQLFDLTLSTNVTGPACLTEAMTPLLRKAKQRPCIVFVSSRMGSLAESLNPDTPFYKSDYKSYDASKAGVNVLTANYARILGADMRARVNSVCPGLIKTNLIGYMEAGDTPDRGAQRIIEMVTLAEDDETTGTFSDRWGKIDWGTSMSVDQITKNLKGGSSLSVSGLDVFPSPVLFSLCFPLGLGARQWHVSSDLGDSTASSGADVIY
ncbi:hypothetical protein UA08_04020 [Talaromyces atroroseus]|uniref:Uncharacterized protein n=1 Tax=Talaromyces atroroseus TaxID=1441469 RepID=A0A1Q5Q8V0_TALAT|nr:hypothetical protein UA08_04020 [Talaromyces atroroseus]OKL60380.1 hypothetical protein UA08_04020 [Talaromyces atroroseus]